jgi:endonuclease YncB( thermonuclease family)
VRYALVLLILANLALAPARQELHGRVVRIADGDTITVLDAANQQHHVRLNGIDAPETSQPFSAKSKAHLSGIVAGKDVTVVGSKLDRYGRLVGTVIVGATNANLEQLRAGLAWYYRQYASDVAPENRPLYEAAEAQAKAAKIGLWSDAAPVAPWTFRHEPAASATTPAPTARALMAPRAPTVAVDQHVIGNRRSHIYHLPSCRDYGRIAAKNQVPFRTEAEAQAAGYRKAGNCPALSTPAMTIP